MEQSFHGRTYGALSVTGNTKYRLPFGQMTGDVQFARLNDLESVEKLMNEKTAAVILEPVQGEGGLIPATEEFLKGVRKLCDERGVVLIFDEIQCGMGRTGDFFAWQKFGVKPDIMTCAKALGAGVPVGAFLMTEEMGQSSLTAGDHGTTYGGNPLAGAAINAVLDIFEEDDLVGHVREVAPCLEEKLSALVQKYPFILEYRGRGLMQGLVFDRPVGPVIAAAMEKGLIFINAGPEIIRFLPPLNVTKEQIDQMYEILVSSIEEAFC
jgi:acetylornithine/N-succinyldiaminopimelate aminotransferase